MARIHGWKKSNYQPDPQHPRFVVDCSLWHTDTTPDVFWSERKNSYVLAEAMNPEEWGEDWLKHSCWLIDGKWVQLLSINGGGEVRWDASRRRVEDSIKDEGESWFPRCEDFELLAAARHFALI